ncbi:Nucleoid occlusion protein [subsurface metagenome]
MSKITYINLADLMVPKFEAHKQIPDEYIAEITKSIKTLGIIEPLIVRAKDKEFEIVAGCIRFRCAKIAGLKSAPCIILSLDDNAAEVLKIHENIKRVPLDHVDQGNTFVMLRDELSRTEQDIASLVGKSVAYVSQHISLVSQDEELIKAVREKRISFSQARELMQVTDKSERRRLLHYCEKDGATVEVLKEWVKDYKNSLIRNSPSSAVPESIHYEHDRPQDFRLCQACDNPTNISEIRHIFLCKPCQTAIMNAILEEKLKNTPNNTHRDAQGKP